MPGEAPERRAQDIPTEALAFAAHAGHELRNPLNALCAALEVLEARVAADADAAEAVQVALRQAHKLVEIVDELLPRSGGLRTPDIG